MSFSKKIGFIFTLIILLTIFVASVGWFGSSRSIRQQNEILLFSSYLKEDFYRIAYNEQFYRLDALPIHSQTVFSAIETLRTTISQKTRQSDEQQKNLLKSILSDLDQYEKMFLLFTSYLVDYQALSSRLQAEIEKLLASSVRFIEYAEQDAGLFHQKIVTLLTAHADAVSTNPKDAALEDAGGALHSLFVYLHPFTSTNNNERTQLATFRLNRSIDIYSLTLDKYKEARKLLVNHSQLRQNQLDALRHSIDRYITIQSEVVQNRSSFYFFLSLFITLCAGIIAIIATFYLSRVIVRPITLLKQSAKEIVQGNLDTQVQVFGNDEIGQLSTIFNEMTSKLRSSFTSLERYKKHLESLVNERTEELQKEIEEKEIAKRSIVASHNNIQQMINQIPFGIILWDKDFNVQQWNPGAEKIFGFSPEEALGKHANFIVAPESKSKVHSVFVQITKKKQQVRSVNSNLTKDGQPILCEWQNEPFLDHHGNLTGILSTVEDITVKRRQEKEHLKIAKLESAGLLAGGIAHDFNNILTGVLGNINLALLDPHLNQKTTTLLESSEKAAIRAKSLTEQLLTFAKGGYPVKETTSLKEIITESASFVLRGGNVSIEYSFDPDLYAVNADKGQISQVIQNLILNSRQSMPDGGIIQILCTNHLQDSNLMDDNTHPDQIHLIIRDSGIGIPESMLDKIFDPYFSTKQDGSGLGLAVVHSIIKKHGGTISVESQPGGGTTFHIYLPASQEQDHSLSLNRSQHSLPTYSWSILLMDDDPSVLQVIEEILVSQGHTVTKTHDGEECIATFAKRLDDDPFDLVIMDLTVPGGMGGKEAISHILDINSDARVIVSSGYSHDPVLSTYKDFGFIAALSKPFTSQEINELIRKVQHV